MWNEYGMPPQDICPEEDGGMRPHYNIRDEEVCLDIDSDERLDQRNMFTDPHKHKRQQSSQQSRRPHKDRALSPSSRSERGFSPAVRSKPQYSSMPHRHKAKKHSRDHDRSFSPRGSEDHGKLTIGKRKGEKLQKTLDHRNHERDLPRKWKEEDKNGNTEDSSSTSSLQESDPIKNTSVYENESVKLVREPLSDSNKHDKESDKSDMRCPEVDMSGIVRSDNDCSDLAVV
ncbi:uncharacterized protein LOC134825217 [Bolinopsis microptera]|uniref:uncharacterized protein LOC134825217 n=1 Tax=Bolinopsis microptera TaxID=2820187 RepID=UPI003078C937